MMRLPCSTRLMAFLPLLLLLCCSVPLSSTVLLVAADAGSHLRGPVLRHYSIEHPYITDWWQEGLPHWDILHDTVVTSKFIRLTPEVASTRGGLWGKIPYPFRGFELRARFVVRSKRNPGADGIAFWYVERRPKVAIASMPMPASVGRGGGGATPSTLREEEVDTSLFGHAADFKGVGVVFDSYDNDYRRDNPATNLLLHDGTPKEWDHPNDLFRDARARCSFDHRNQQAADPVEMTLTYTNRKLTLRLRSYLRNIDLICGEVDNVDLPTDGYFGVTASTGAIVDNHDVISIEVRRTDGGGDPADGASAEDKAVHFDHLSDATQQSFWNKQERARPRHSERPPGQAEP